MLTTNIVDCSNLMGLWIAISKKFDLGIMPLLKFHLIV